MISLSVDGQEIANGTIWPYGDDLYRVVKFDVTSQAKDGSLNVSLHALSDCTFWLQKAELDINGEAPPAPTQNVNGFEEVCTKTTWAMLDPAQPIHIDNTYLVDVRSPYEYVNVGHAAPDASGRGDFLAGKVIHIPWEYRFYDAKGEEVTSKRYANPNFLADIKARFKAGDRLILICRTGHRSGAAATMLVKENLGITVYNAVEGMSTDLGWIPNNYPISRSMDGLYDEVGLASVEGAVAVTAAGGDSSSSNKGGGCAMNPEAGLSLDIGLILVGAYWFLRRRVA